ncbi:MAG TPA: hypothetical protein GXZ44_00295 [Fermentimonas caenicola]|jgi:hypothetical protein|uniref:Bacterial Pleckstrin homology domain-containing protein n=1 Tax=Fermentimonas caenicola TaxID=1562970 RepID=A0A098BXR0_9BACT|nr:hypothetical protein [Lascolabacillus sp.]MBP6196623.1 hypothetical protein [Fermentimonas sp.]MDI9625915.1 hypothetical protein [Bacteroidota bacterium]CEA14951.1 hypothetical protein ING2E5B_0181 [Fermentimonas caenicola]MBP7104430.1 hypothetical protein [Fermentimonas sp.]MCK9501825.1 hypothetical protein [Lascolabacillus sp.]
MRINKINFIEEQRQGPFIWIVLLLINSIFIFGTIKQIGMGEPFGDTPMSDIGLIIVAVLILLSSLPLAVFCKLQTFINSDGIYIRYFPFQWKYKLYDWNNIEMVFITKYKPFFEYGGWGFRKRLKGTVAYTVKGKIGLMIKLKNGKSVLIGTQKPEYLKEILIKLGKYGVEIG